MSLIENAKNPQSYFMTGLEETIGPNELRELIEGTGIENENQEESLPDQVIMVRQKMDEVYGKSGASGLAICSGRAAFQHVLNQQSRQIGFEEDAFRFLPGRNKLKKGLRLLANWLEKENHETIQMENSDGHWLLSVSDDRESSECENARTMCDFTAGLLQEFMTWAGGGKYFRVTETDCRKNGANSCSIQIDKKPIE